MAMKIGGEYDADKITPKHFEKLAEEAGLSKPMVKRRVMELAQLILANKDNVPQPAPISTTVANLINQRCERVLNIFQND